MYPLLDVLLWAKPNQNTTQNVFCECERHLPPVLNSIISVSPLPQTDMDCSRESPPPLSPSCWPLTPPFLRLADCQRIVGNMGPEEINNTHTHTPKLICTLIQNCVYQVAHKGIAANQITFTFQNVIMHAAKSIRDIKWVFSLTNSIYFSPFFFVGSTR